MKVHDLLQGTPQMEDLDQTITLKRTKASIDRLSSDTIVNVNVNAKLNANSESDNGARSNSNTHPKSTVSCPSAAADSQRLYVHRHDDTKLQRVYSADESQQSGFSDLSSLTTVAIEESCQLYEYSCHVAGPFLDALEATGTKLLRTHTSSHAQPSSDAMELGLESTRARWASASTASTFKRRTPSMFSIEVDSRADSMRRRMRELGIWEETRVMQSTDKTAVSSQSALTPVRSTLTRRSSGKGYLEDIDDESLYHFLQQLQAIDVVDPEVAAAIQAAKRAEEEEIAAEEDAIQFLPSSESAIEADKEDNEGIEVQVEEERDLPATSVASASSRELQQQHHRPTSYSSHSRVASGNIEVVRNGSCTENELVQDSSEGFEDPDGEDELRPVVNWKKNDMNKEQEHAKSQMSAGTEVMMNKGIVMIADHTETIANENEPKAETGEGFEVPVLDDTDDSSAGDGTLNQAFAFSI